MGTADDTLPLRGGSLIALGGPVFDLSGGTTLINVPAPRSATDQLGTVSGGGTVTLDVSGTRPRGTIAQAALVLSPAAA
ncbi:hypothetical protein ACQEWB_48745 [Streptomyces sp. CA-249302]|uniref:hypothetical protein n=1 Tax=Streptomyces sp. CA-249302 TaxID=3240058 RepID=UPI003D907B4F